MSCYTIYIVREPDGSLWAQQDRYGAVDFESADELLEHLGRFARFALGDQPIRAADCRGWFVDAERRFARVYRCALQASEDPEIARRLRHAPGWAGWDVQLLPEKHLELSALAGLPEEIDEHVGHLDGWVGAVEAGLLTLIPERLPHRWDAETQRLTCDYPDVTTGTIVTVIDRRQRVRDYHFEDHSALFQILGHGPQILDILGDAPPCPPPYSAERGVAIDEPRRTVRFFVGEPVAPATLAEVRRRWLGWIVEREVAQFEGHLVRTGRDAEVAVAPYPLEARGLSLVTHTWIDPLELAPQLSDEERALRAAICADLDSDDARQVYADLLIGRGDRRGELINVQCELARLARVPVWPARRRSLAVDETRLLRLYGRARVTGTSRSEYERGFIAGVDVQSVRELIEHSILDGTPTIDRVRLVVALTAADVATLAGIPGISRLRSLAVTATSRVFDRMRATGAFAGLRQLTLELDQEDTVLELARALAGPHPLAHLERLAVRGIGCTDRAVCELVAAIRVPALSICSTVLTPAGVRRLAALPGLAAVTRLTLAETIEREGVQALASSPHLANLETLELFPNPGLEDVTPLLASRNLDTLCNLEVGGLGDHGVIRLAAEPGLARLRRLAICQSCDAAALLALATGPHIDALDELALTRTTLDDDRGVAALRERLGDRLVIR